MLVQIELSPQYTTNYKRGQDDIPIKANYAGNNIKTMRISVDARLV